MVEIQTIKYINKDGNISYFPRAQLKAEDEEKLLLESKENAIALGLVSLSKEKEQEILINTYEIILEVLDDWVVVEDDVKKAIAIWVIGTYYHETFNTYPYLFFNAMRGSGKTRILKLISWLGNQGDGTVQNDMSQAVLFRVTRNKILCIDEFENVASKEKQVLRQLLNAAYKKGMKVTRMKKSTKQGEEKFIAESFEPYMPVCMANIWGMDEVLGDRSLTFIIEKSDDPRITKKVEDFENCTRIKQIKANLSRISVVKCSVVTPKQSIIMLWNNYLNDKYKYTSIQKEETTPNYIDNDYEGNLDLFNALDEAGIDGRNFELIFPLLIVAKKISSYLFEEILLICKKMVGDKRKDELAESKDVIMFNFISNQSAIEWIPVKKLTGDLRMYLGDELGDEPWLNDKWVGRSLKRLNLVLKKRRQSSGMEVLLNVTKAREKSNIFKKGENKDEQ